MKALAVSGVVVVLFAMFLFGFIGFKNDCVRFENGLDAKHKENRTVYDNGWKEVVEKSQVPEMYTAQLKELYDGAMTGRYGPDGSKALFQFIKEQNPTLDASLLRQIQQSVESFRGGFTQAQKELADMTRAYKNRFETFPGSLYNSFVGFPHVDLAKYDMVTSAKTEKAFETHSDEPLDLRPKKK